MQPVQDGLHTKLFWIWIGWLISVLVFWSLRNLWLKYRPPLDMQTKYSRRLAKRLRDRQALRLRSKPPKKSRPHDHH